jgi:hypothetical protein
MSTNAEKLEELKMQIALNEMLPATMQCAEAIAEMKARVKTMERTGGLRLVKAGEGRPA